MKLLAASLLMLGLSAPAFAQPLETDTGSHIMKPAAARIPEKRGSMSKIEQARIAVAEFARCTIARYSARVDRVLAMPLGPEYDKAINALAEDDCLSMGQLRFDKGLFRGALYVQLLRGRTEAEAKGKAWPHAVQPLDVNAPIDGKSTPAAMHQAVLWFGDCAARRAPRAARDVAMLPTASAEQDAAFKALVPELGPCLLQGSKLRLSKAVLEGILAEVLYRSPPIAATGSNESGKVETKQ